MFPKITGKAIQITCSEQAFPEFPGLLFGTSPDNGIRYFDATAYLQKNDLSITDFFSKYEEQIKVLAHSYNISAEQICKLNSEGHYLIDESFVFLFISFIDQDFMAYVCDRIYELFNNGFCISDTYLVETAKHRLTGEALTTIFENGQSK